MAQRSLHPCGPVEKSCAHCRLVSPENSRRKRMPDLCSLLNTVLIVFLWLLSSWAGFVLTNSGQSFSGLQSPLENLPRSHRHGFYQQRIGAVPSRSLPESTDIHRVSPTSKCWVLSAGYLERKETHEILHPQHGCKCSNRIYKMFQVFGGTELGPGEADNSFRKKKTFELGLKGE